MTSSLRNITVDCHDPLALGRFWAAVLGWNVYFDEDPPVLVAPSYPPGRGHDAVHPGAGTAYREEPVAHRSGARGDRARDEEVARLVELGATVVEDHRDETGAGLGWVWLADPEGNDFCVERSAAERATTTPKLVRITESG